jgi:LuxR family maltose regulon positive regulatory protein
MVPAGMAALKADAATALEGMRRDSPFMPGVRLLVAVASILDGRLDEAEVLAREARELGEARGAMPGFAMSIAEEAALVLRSGRKQQAWDLVRYGLEKVRAAGLEGYVLSGLLHAVAARAALAMALTADATHHIAQVNRVRPRLTAAVPWLAVQVRLETMRVHLAMDDAASARTLMVEVDDILRVRPDLGTLSTEAASIRAQIEASREGGAGRWTLTNAELSVLAYLPTHLTFADIAERLFISRHTVKSHAVSIYGKLGVSSRRDAVEIAVERGLLDPSAVRFPPAAVG